MSKQLGDSIKLEPGQTIDLGDLKADAELSRLPPEFQAGAVGFQSVAKEQTNGAEKDDQDKVTVLQGRIVTDGSNEPPADLKLFKARINFGNQTSKNVLLPASSIEQDGAFSVEMTNLPSSCPKYEIGAALF